MGLGFRQLFSDSLGDSIDSVCEKYCDEPEDDSGYCLPVCLDVCPEICHYSLTSLNSSSDLPHHAKSKSLMVILLSILAAVFLLLCCFVVYVKYYGHRRRSPAPPEPHRDDFVNEDREPVVDHHIWYIRTNGLQPSVISSITVCKYKRGDGLVEGTECSVCLNEFQEDETIRLLPKCSHAFHLPCIDTWLRSHTNCPMCRAPIVAIPALTSSSEVNADEEVPRHDTRVADLGDINGEPAIEIQGGEEEEEMVEIQPMRRSVSLDSLSASKISAALRSLTDQEENSSDSELGRRKESNWGIVPKRGGGNQGLARLVGSSSSFGRSMLLNRSLSCTGKFWLSRCSRSRNSGLP